MNYTRYFAANSSSLPICLLCNRTDRNQNLISSQEPRSKRRVITCPDRFANDSETVLLNPRLQFLLVPKVALFTPNTRVSDSSHPAGRDLPQLDPLILRVRKGLNCLRCGHRERNQPASFDTLLSDRGSHLYLFGCRFLRYRSSHRDFIVRSVFP